MWHLKFMTLTMACLITGCAQDGGKIQRRTDAQGESPKKQQHLPNDPAFGPAGSDNTPPSSASPTSTSSAVAPTSTYYGEVAAIFSDKCAPCHYPGAQAPDLSTLAAIKANAAAAVAAMTGGKMPPARNLAATDAETVRAWIAGGQPSGEQRDPVATTNVKAVLDQRCVPCHYPSGQSPDLSTYEGAKGSGYHLVIGVKILGSMPPAKNATIGQITQITTWVSQGMLQSAYNGQ